MNAKASPISITEPAHPPHPFWSGAFRPLFLLAGILAIVGVVWWVAGMAHGMPTPTMGSGAWWHGHEMIFGFGGAAIGGFLLTAIANWTGRPPIAGRLLMVLTATWLIARLASGFADSLPLALTLIGGLGYFITLMAIAGRELIQGRNHRNLVILGLIGLLTLMDGLFIASTLGAITLDPMVIYQTAILVIVLLIGLIGGRIIPAFTRNWMQRDGIVAPMPVMFNRFDGVCLAALAIAIVINLFDPTHQITGVALLLAGVLHLIRMARWRGIYTWRDPLVAILHLAYVWVPVGLIVLGIAMLAPDVMAARDALHGLTGGAMACMILAIGGRAALGHTGRDLRASPALLIAFGAIWIGTVLRLLVGISTDYYMVILAAATLLWIGGWIAFLIGYAPVLLGPARQKSRGIPVR
ncbi:MAG: NnrS family protein [Pseudomonadota bacterium]